MIRQYAVDVYVDQCEWEGFSAFETLAEAREYAKSCYEKPKRSHLCDDKVDDLAEKHDGMDVSALETWTWADHDSNYATVYRIEAKRRYAVIDRDGHGHLRSNETTAYSTHATEKAAIREAKNHGNLRMVIRGEDGFTTGQTVGLDTIRRDYPVIWNG